MDKLQYDSFYKFLVSLGTILITIPFIVMYYLLFSGNELLLSQTEYEQLSKNSLFILQKREALITNILKWLPTILILFILIGIVCLLYGSFKWSALQKELDEQLHLTTVEQRHGIEKLTASEILEKTIIESNEIVNDDASTSPRKNHIQQALRIENLCFKYLHQKLSKKYLIEQNVRIYHYEYDLIATAKHDGPDYIYEIKYWTKVPSIQLIDDSLALLKRRGDNYYEKIHREYLCVLLIVVPDDRYHDLRKKCEQYLNEYDLGLLNVQFISENTLY